jgi:hypothetical protein
MSETVRHFLQQRQKALSHQLSSLSSAAEELAGAHKLTAAEADCLLQTTGEQAIDFLKSELKTWQSLLRKDEEFMVRT